MLAIVSKLKGTKVSLFQMQKYTIPTWGCPLNHKEILYMQFRSVYHPSHSETFKIIFCDTLTKILHLLNVGSLGYKNKKLMLWGFGLVPIGSAQWAQVHLNNIYLTLSAKYCLNINFLSYLWTLSTKYEQKIMFIQDQPSTFRQCN